jgi:hypothetical protein
MPGCVIEAHPAPPPDSEVGFDSAMNLGQSCGADLTSWQVTLLESGTTLGGSCAYRPIFGGLAPNTPYTFDIVGYSGPQICWRGTCSVPTAWGTLTWGECFAEVQHLCGF